MTENKMEHKPANIAYGMLALDSRRKPEAPIWPTEPEKAEHLHGWALREIADGAPVSNYQVQRKDWEPDEWQPLTAWIGQVIGGQSDAWEIRRKPSKVVMHQIVPGGPQFPAPLTEMPEIGTMVYWATAMADAVISEDWRGESFQEHRLSIGALHLRKEAAEQQMEAIAHALRGTPV